MEWVIEPEVVACIILFIIASYSFRERAVVILKLSAFRWCLVISLFAIVVNIGAIYAIEHAASIPVRLNNWISGLYFAATLLMTTALGAYTLLLIFEDRYDAPRLHRALGILGALYAVAFGLIATNGYHGLIFRFDSSFQYIRGPLNKITLAHLVLELAVIIACYLLERRRTGRAFSRVVQMILPMALVLGLWQALVPNTMLTGTIASLTLLILFINDQQQRVNIDHLTELANREAFFTLLNGFVRGRQPFSVVIISLRDYKAVNNRFGQRGGDNFLRQVGLYLQHFRRNAISCRFSAVEFAVILPGGTANADSEQAFDTLIERFRHPWVLPNGQTTMLNACFADIAYPEHASDINELIMSLEYAVRLAKSSETHEPVRFSKQLRSRFGRRNYVIGLLEPALLNERFYLNYQPIYDCQQERVIGAEVLLRLREEDGRPVPPGEFIPLAEETGIIGQLSWLVLDKTCRFLSDHRDIGIEWLSINISALQFENREVVTRVFDTLEKYELQPYALKLEITERVIVDDMAQAKDILEELKAGGVGVCLDDFGTGYSNLANVSSLPFECVKVDKSFIDDIVRDERSFAMLETIIQGLKSMEMDVLAEGVETEEQCKIVNMLHVDKIQGYYYSKPLEKEDFVRRMIEQ